MLDKESTLLFIYCCLDGCVVLLDLVLLELFCLRIWSYVNTLIFERFVMDF